MVTGYDPIEMGLGYRTKSRVAFKLLKLASVCVLVAAALPMPLPLPVHRQPGLFKLAGRQTRGSLAMPIQFKIYFLLQVEAQVQDLLQPLAVRHGAAVAVPDSPTSRDYCKPPSSVRDGPSP